jgi:hypothetical protein
MNNPLNTTDPSGFSWLSKAFHRLGNWIRGNWRSIVSIVVVAVLTWGLGTFASLGAYSSGAISGGVSGGLNAGLNGGDFNDILRGVAVSGAQGAIAAGFLHPLGEAAGAAGTFSAETALHVAGHGVLGGASNAALGGKFQDGFLSAATSTFAADAGLLGAEGGGAVGIASRTIRASVIGGSASALGGGKFANGAYTAAFQHLLNEEVKEIAKIVIAYNGNDPGTPGSAGIANGKDFKNSAKILSEQLKDSVLVDFGSVLELNAKLQQIGSISLLYIIDHGAPEGFFVGTYNDKDFVIRPNSPDWSVLARLVNRGGGIVLCGCATGKIAFNAQMYARFAPGRHIVTFQDFVTHDRERGMLLDNAKPVSKYVPISPATEKMGF